MRHGTLPLALAPPPFVVGSGPFVTLKTLHMYRGIAALVISASHAIEVLGHHGFDGLHSLQNRTGGVDFLFTLSGFLIFLTYSKYREREDLMNIFMRPRFLKIYPLVWFFTLLSLLFYFPSSEFGAGSETHLKVIVNSLFLFPQAVAPVLGSTWSLSHIVLFYVVFQCYLYRPRTTLVAIEIWVSIFVAVLVFGLPETAAENPSVWMNFIFSPFNLEFLLGACLSRFLMTRDFKYGFLSAGIGISIFLVGWTFLQGNASPMLMVAVFCSASLFLIFGGVAIDRHHPFEMPRVFDRLGHASYAVIILNLPTTVLFSKFLEKVHLENHHAAWVSWCVLFVAVVIAGIGGIFTNRVIEPILLNLFTPKRLKSAF